MLNMFNWVPGALSAYNHGVYAWWYWTTKDDGRHTDYFFNLYFTVISVAVIVALIIASIYVTDTYNADWKDWTRIVSGIVIGALVWPQLVLLAAVALVLAGPVFVFLSWFDLVPSKAERIAKREKKAAELRAEVDELKRSAA